MVESSFERDREGFVVGVACFEVGMACFGVGRAYFGVGRAYFGVGREYFVELEGKEDGLGSFEGIEGNSFGFELEGIVGAFGVVQSGGS